MAQTVVRTSIHIGSFSGLSIQERLDLPLVSVIMPAYNAASTLEESIDSVLAQTYLNWELIIADDCSTDQTAAIAKRYADMDPRIRYLRMPANGRQARARNCAIREAEGRFIAFLDSDDLWMPNKLSVQIWTMLENELPFIYSSYRLLEKVSRDFVFNPPTQLTYEELLKSNSIGCLTAVYDVQHLGKRYMPVSVDRQEDYALWLDICKEFGVLHGINEPLAKYRVSSTSLSSNKLVVSRSQWKVYRLIEGLNLLKSVYYQFHYIFKGFLKYRVRRNSRPIYHN